MRVRRYIEKLYNLDAVYVSSTGKRSVMAESAEELSILNPAYMVKRLGVALPTERAPNLVQDENCSISCTRRVECESGESGTIYYEQCTFAYSSCVEYEGYLKSLFREYGGSIFLNGTYEPTNRRYKIDGKLINKEYEGYDDSRRWRGYRVEADSFTIEMER